MKKIQWGLVIQGPIITFGQGGNNCESGYGATEAINENINAFAALVNQIVVSTWENSGFVLVDNPALNVVVLENALPCAPDPDNRKKQFVSTQAGIKYLTLNTKVTHVLKIRTDQIVPPSIIKWLTEFFISEELGGEFKRSGKIVFSEFIKSEKFFVGDFIFAAKVEDLLGFVMANVTLKNNLYPSIGVDYYLKHILVNDHDNFKRVFVKGVPLIAQISRNDIATINNYWSYQLIERCSFLPKFIADEFIWRGRLMKDLGFKHFCYYEDWLTMRGENEQLILSENKTKIYSLLMIKVSVLKSIKYEYTRYFITRLKFFLPNIYVFIRGIKHHYLKRTHQSKK
ncbi:MAG: hypothetical protein WCS87_12770 [Methylococcaceae bacterium]